MRAQVVVCVELGRQLVDVDPRQTLAQLVAEPGQELGLAIGVQRERAVTAVIACVEERRQS